MNILLFNLSGDLIVEDVGTQKREKSQGGNGGVHNMKDLSKGNPMIHHMRGSEKLQKCPLFQQLNPYFSSGQTEGRNASPYRVILLVNFSTRCDIRGSSNLEASSYTNYLKLKLGGNWWELIHNEKDRSKSYQMIHQMWVPEKIKRVPPGHLSF